MEWSLKWIQKATPYRIVITSAGKNYNERTSVKRCNSRLKTYLTADAMHVWGIRKVTTHQYLNAIVLLASALAMAGLQAKSQFKFFSVD
jgi:hypothetical protein